MDINYRELIKLFEKGKKRYHLIGSQTAGVLVGLDLEGRLFTILNGEVLNRVNPDAILGQSTKATYLNPGGDGLWPAPEGSCLGYQYSTGSWRVPPGLTGARYLLTESGDNKGTIRAEIDLINTKGIGIATVFERHISVQQEKDGVLVKVAENIEYIGTKTLTKNDCLLAPWTLCQLDCETGCEVVFPAGNSLSVWDFYDSSESQRFYDGSLWHAKPDNKNRYQIGLGQEVEWIEFRNPQQKLTVKRRVEPILSGMHYIDIADRLPEETPHNCRTR